MNIDGDSVDWPRGAEAEIDESLTLPFNRKGDRRIYPVPYMDREYFPFVRPSATICFSTHPLGINHLYGRADYLGNKLAESEKFVRPEGLSEALWIAALRAYEPGAPIRDAIPRLSRGVGSDASLNALRSEDDVERMRIDLLAVYLVRKAICDMPMPEG